MRWTLGNLLVALLQLYESLSQPTKISDVSRSGATKHPLLLPEHWTNDNVIQNETRRDSKRSHAAQKSGQKQAENRTVDRTVQKF